MNQITSAVADVNGWAIGGAIFKWAVWPAIVAGFVSWKTASKTIDAQRERLRREFQLEFATETAIKTLLENESYTMRSFEKIKRHLPGFEDNELRRFLIRAGAVKFSGDDEQELWGLLERHKGGVFK